MRSVHPVRGSRRAFAAGAAALLLAAAVPLRALAQAAERRMPGFRLRRPSGQPLTEKDLLGQWAVVFFGYTSCPDVCPTTMSMLTDAFARMGAGADGMRGLFITVDPKRDTPEVLAAYVANFSPRIAAATGTPAEVEAAARAFGLRFQIHGDPASVTYTVDHPAVMLVFEPGGRFVSLVPHGASAAELVALIARLQKREAP